MWCNAQALSDREVIRMCQLAYNASYGVGLGLLNPNVKRSLSFDDAASALSKCLVIGEIHMDYVNGRMVKLRMHRNAEGLWEFPSRPLNPEYQSWCTVYPSYDSLVQAAKQDS